MWSYVREEASYGSVYFLWLVRHHDTFTLVVFLMVVFEFVMQKAPIDPFNKESAKPSASQGVPLGGMG